MRGLCRGAGLRLALVTVILSAGPVRADLVETIERIKPAIVAVGSYKATNSPPYMMRGTGFVVGNGNLVATNAHVVAPTADQDGAALMVQVRVSANDSQLRPARVLAVDREHDLALLRIEGVALPRMTLSASDNVREGQGVAFTGFPIGAALGFSPVTHRGIVSAITPIALPMPNAQRLNEKVIQRLKNGSFLIYQLDATAYPGNSGSPVFDPETGEVFGVINMVFVKGSKEAALTQPSGIAYAIPAGFLQSLLSAASR